MPLTADQIAAFRQINISDQFFWDGFAHLAKDWPRFDYANGLMTIRTQRKSLNNGRDWENFNVTEYFEPDLTVIADHPAYTIHRPVRKYSSVAGCDIVTLSDGDEFGMAFFSKNYGVQHHWFQIGSVVSYSLKSGSCPIEALARATNLGHDLHFVFGLGASITSDRKAKTDKIALEWGQMIVFEGRIFELRKAPNDNVRLAPVNGDIAAALKGGAA